MCVEGGGVAGKTWPCAICLWLGGPYCNTSRHAGIYRPGRGKLAKVNGSTRSRFLVGGGRSLAVT